MPQRKKLPVGTVNGIKLAKIENVKKGELIRRIWRNGEPMKKVYQAAGYCRFNRAYQCDDWEDISNEIYLKKGTRVHIDFDF